MFKKSKKIGVFQLSLLSISSIISLRSLPLFAETGFSIIFFLLVASLMFFIPISLVVAELSLSWPSRGGCYLWIKKAYGKKWAFIALWAYWMESILWFPVILIFIVTMLAYVLNPIYPNLENNNIFIILGIIIIFWLLTFINFFGLKVSAIFSSIGTIIGTVIPISLIMFLGIFWIIKDNPINITFSYINLFPKFDTGNIVFFSSILLGLSGIELISFHISEVDSPKKNFIKALFMASFFILFIYIIGSLSIAIVVPKKDIYLASGIIQALNVFFSKLNILFATPFLALLLFIGSLSSMNTWLIGPAKGMLLAAEDGILPKKLAIVNQHDVPVLLLIIQATLGSLICLFFLFCVKSMSGLIWIFTCLSFQFASFLYIMIFISILKLRKKYPNLKRPFKVPYIYFISGIGIFSCVFTFFISYAQPVGINVYNGSSSSYFILLIFVFLLLMLPAFFFIFFFKK